MRGGAYINVYQLVDKEGNEVMRGTAPDIAEKLKCSIVTVSNAGRPGNSDPHSDFWLRMGVNCTAKEVNDCDVMMRLKPVGRRKKSKTHYFVEVKQRWTTKPSQPI